MQWVSDLPRHKQGVQAIFAVTNFWEHVFTGSTPPESRDKEVEQGMQVFTFDSNFLTKHKSNTDYQSYLKDIRILLSIVRPLHFTCIHHLIRLARER